MAFIAMGLLFQPLLFLLVSSTTDDLQKQVELLKLENELLKKASSETPPLPETQ